MGCQGFKYVVCNARSMWCGFKISHKIFQSLTRCKKYVVCNASSARDVDLEQQPLPPKNRFDLYIWNGRRMLLE
jgi:hypothetical protein